MNEKLIRGIGEVRNLYTDEELVTRSQEELPYRTDAFELPLEHYEPQVFTTCRRYLWTAEGAEEASQDS